jgi:hypothetical protein
LNDEETFDVTDGESNEEMEKLATGMPPSRIEREIKEEEEQQLEYELEIAF